MTYLYFCIIKLQKKYTKQCTYLLMIFLLSLTTIYATAQKRMVYGYVLDSITYSPITNAQITNTNTTKVVTTNASGIFSMYTGINDLLFLNADNYHFRTFLYTSLLQDTLIIYMAPLVHELAAVTVTAKGYSKYQQDSMIRRQEFLTDLVRPKRKLATAEKYGQGMVVNLDYFSKFQKSKRQRYKLEDEHEKDAYINYRFSRETVQQYTGFTGDTLQQFINLYRPEYDWLRKNTSDEDVMYYIFDHVKLFYMRKENQ